MQEQPLVKVWVDMSTPGNAPDYCSIHKIFFDRLGHSYITQSVVYCVLYLLRIKQKTITFYVVVYNNLIISQCVSFLVPTSGVCTN